MNNPDKVVGYIEYLGAGGMIGEIVPYSLSPKAVCIWPRCGAAWILRGWTCLPLSP